MDSTMSGTRNAHEEPYRHTVLKGQHNEVVSALQARGNFGNLLRRVEDERRSLVIEKRGKPKAVLLSIRDYEKLAAPEPEVLRVIGEESERKGRGASPRVKSSR